MRRTRLPFIAASVLAAFLAWSPATIALAQDDAVGEDGLPDLTEIKATLEKIRGLRFLRDVPAERQSVEDFKAYLTRDLDKTYPPEKFADIMDGLLRLGMLNEKIDLGEAFIGAIMSQAAAHYDPFARKFYYLMGDMPMSALQTVAAHELVHALQDQHFDLQALMLKFEAPPDDAPRDDDAMQAIRFLVEGEATYVHTVWQMKAMMNMDMMANPQMEETQLGMMARMDVGQMAKMAAAQVGNDGAMAQAIKDMEKIPSYIMVPLYAAYMQGAYFTMKARHAGGWERVAQVWADLPVSTEQVMHPEKYLGEERDVPSVITLPEFQTLEKNGWKVIDAAIHGELMLNLLLREQGVPRRQADRAAEGWDGDLYRAWRRAEDGRVMIALATTWDSEEDARQFFAAYRVALDRKYPDKVLAEDQEGLITYACGKGLGVGALALRGQEVFALEGVDENMLADLLPQLLDSAIERIGRVRPQAALPCVKAAGLSFAIQPGWEQETPANEMRVAQFLLPAAPGDADETRLIVFFFDHHTGDVQANLDRWMDQFDLDADPTITERTAGEIVITTADLSGRYVAESRPGSGDFQNKPNWRMLASIVQTKQGPYYFRMVGPKATIDRWASSYKAMLASIAGE